MYVDNSTFKQVFFGMDASWKGRKYFLEFCNQDSLCVLYRFSITYRTFYWQYHVENMAWLDIFFFGISIVYIVKRICIIGAVARVIITRNKSRLIILSAKKTHPKTKKKKKQMIITKQNNTNTASQIKGLYNTVQGEWLLKVKPDFP